MEVRPVGAVASTCALPPQPQPQPLPAALDAHRPKRLRFLGDGDSDFDLNAAGTGTGTGAGGGKGKEKEKRPIQFGAFNSFAQLGGAPKQVSTPPPKRLLQPLRALPAPIPVSLSRAGATHLDSPSTSTPTSATKKKPSKPLQPFDSFAAQPLLLQKPAPTTTTTKPKPLAPLPAFSLPSKPSTASNTNTTPLRALKRPGTPPRFNSPSTPISEKASALFGALPPSALNSKKKEEGTGVRLGDLAVPKAPPPTTEWDADDDGTGAGGAGGGIAMQWSPRKKSAKYSLGGLASRTSSLLSRTRTDETLWLHSLSRLVAPYQTPSSPPLPHAALAKLVQPAVRLVVLETLPLRRPTTPSSPTSDTIANRPWDISKTVLARCRLLLDSSPPPPLPDLLPPSQSSSSQTSSSSSQSSSSSPELTGLVLLSLHSKPPSSTTSTTRSIPPPFLHTRKQPPGGGDHATLFLPTNPHDLRFVVPGVEVWAWDPLIEVEMPENGVGVEGFLGGGRSEPEGEVEGGARGQGGEDGEGAEVFWDDRSTGVRDKEREEREKRDERSENGERALVCARFGIVG